MRALNESCSESRRFRNGRWVAAWLAGLLLAGAALNTTAADKPASAAGKLASSDDVVATNDQAPTPVPADAGGAAPSEFDALIEKGHSGSQPAGEAEDLTGVTTTEAARAQAETAIAGGPAVTSTEEILKLPGIESRFPAQVGIETVCETDERVLINATTSAPWRWSCKLVIHMPDGDYVGTGFLIGSRTVVTAGHCVHGGKGGKWAKSIEVIPGLNGTQRPFGTFVSQRFRSVTGWTQDGKETHDYGAIILSEEIGDRIGYFGFAALPDRDLNSLLANTSGYPADLAGGNRQYYAKGVLKTPEPRQLHYMIDTYGGQSGSAVYRYLNGERHVIGIHTLGGCPNGATRIGQDVYDNLMKWKAEK